MSIDGKAVLAIFGADKLISDLGGADKCKEEFEYFRDICRDLDYEGAKLWLAPELRIKVPLHG